MGTLYLIPDPERLWESAALAEDFGACFEYNGFYDPDVLDDPEECERRINLYKTLGRERSRDTLHGAFYSIAVESEDPLIRRISEKRVRQSMDAARALGVRGVVFHTGTIPNFRNAEYREVWLKRNRLFWQEICREYPETEILMENMFDMEPGFLLALAAEMAEDTNFGICLDYAHAQVFGGDPVKWLAETAPYVRHMHINDNNGLEDQHLAVGDGVIDWETYDRCVRGAGIAPSVLVETRSLERQGRSIKFMQERGIYPFPKGESRC